jgi:transcriptional regulator GlxA family with amidase domain
MRKQKIVAGFGLALLLIATAAPAGFALPQAKLTKRNVAILIFDRAELLDITGPADVFVSTASGNAFRVYTVAASRTAIRAGGLILTPEYTFTDAPRPDVVVLPGGHYHDAVNHEPTMAWVKRSSAEAEIILSVCTGAFILARAGLLDGLDANTHWFRLGQLQKAAPLARVLEKRRYVDNGKIVTSAGVSAGIDAALHIVARLLGEPAARFTAEKTLEYTWMRDPQATSLPREKTGKSETFTGFLMPFQCRNDEPVSHTTECALLPDCRATGYGLLLSDGRFLQFDDAGSEQAEAALKATRKKNDLKASVKGRRTGDSITVESLELQ